jgi:osmotically-inducible protein OsmY
MITGFRGGNVGIKNITGLNPWARFIVALAFFLIGCSGMTGIKLGRYIDDANLNASVSERFAAQKSADFAGVKTEVKDGVIYLSGTVASDEQRSRAEKVAFQVPGTRGVINNLKVENP